MSDKSHMKFCYVKAYYVLKQYKDIIFRKSVIKWFIIVFFGGRGEGEIIEIAFCNSKSINDQKKTSFIISSFRLDVLFQ